MRLGEISSGLVAFLMETASSASVLKRVNGEQQLAWRKYARVSVILESYFVCLSFVRRDVAMVGGGDERAVRELG